VNPTVTAPPYYQHDPEDHGYAFVGFHETRPPGVGEVVNAFESLGVEHLVGLRVDL
jgi:hypothetical protein